MSRNRLPQRSFWGALIAVAVASWPAAALGSGDPSYERLPRLPKTVGVAAFTNYAVDTETLFRESGDPLPWDDRLSAAMGYLLERLAAEEDIELLGDRALRDRVASAELYQRSIPLAREWFDLGVTHFRALRLDRALENLERAANLYREVYQDLVEPHALSELEFYRGMTLAEKGAGDLAHIALKRVFYLNPWKRFVKGYYAPAMEKALQSALVDLLHTTDRSLPLQPEERLLRFMRDSGLDAVLYGRLEKTPKGEPELHVVIYEARFRRIAFHETLHLQGGERDREALDRMVGRWLSCADWEHPKIEKPELPRVFLSSGFVESFYLDPPTRKLFHNVGFTFGFAYQILESLDIFLDLSAMTTLADENEDLFRTATSVRVIAGAGFTVQTTWLRFYINPGLDFTYVGDIAWTSDENTKFFDGVPEEYRPDEAKTPRFKTLDEAYLIGLNLATGLDFILAGGLFINLHVGISAYLFPFTETAEMNFPMMFRAGIGYAF